jgi:septum formation protein
MVILASSSPRRKELLKRIISNFEIKVSNIDESINRPQNVSEIPYELAYRKAKEIAKDYYNDIVIGSDTIVAINNEVLEKPVDEKDAYRMLKLLNNNTHEVISGIAILYQDKEIRYIEKSFVTFNNLTDKEILDYIATKDPLDKAGAYGIQNEYINLVKEFSGEYENIVGLPLIRLEKELKNINK